MRFLACAAIFFSVIFSATAQDVELDWKYQQCPIDELVNLKTLDIKLTLFGIGKNKKVQLTFPKYNEIPCDMWGDWGPMYTFPIAEGAVQFTYMKDGKLVKIKTEGHVRIESPMSAKVRSKYPLIKEVNLDGLATIKIWYKKDGFSHAEIFKYPFTDDLPVTNFTTY